MKRKRKFCAAISTTTRIYRRCALVPDSGVGFHDAYAECHPDDPGFTWSRKNPYVDPSTTRGKRIDYIFSAGDLTPKDCSVVFDGSNGLDFASDHFGVFCNFEFRLH